MRVAALIQARIGSSRLRAKVLKEIAGQTMIARVVNRVRQAKLIDLVAVVTTNSPNEEPLLDELRQINAPTFRGSEDDVLDRYFNAAKHFDAHAVVRITSDCPLIDPGVVDQLITIFKTDAPDYASNTLTRCYPRGLDAEVISVKALDIAWKNAQKPYERAHVTPFIWQDPTRFRLQALSTDSDYSGYRWTVDTQEDLDFVRAVYDRLSDRDQFTWIDVLNLVHRAPELIELNNKVKQKTLEEC